MSQIKTLIDKLLANPGDREVLEELRANSAAALDYFADSEDSIDEARWESLDPAWVAQIYTVLAESDGHSSEDQETLEAMARASESDEARVGEAFVGALLPNLPSDLKRFNHWLGAGSVAKVAKEDVKDLRATPSVQAAGEAGEALAKLGLTPLTLYYATDAFGSLLERTMEERNVQAVDIKFGKDVRDIELVPAIVSREALVEEIQQMTGLDQARCENLLSWTVRAARHLPHLAYGLKASALGDGLEVERDDREFPSVTERWEVSSGKERVPMPSGADETEDAPDPIFVPAFAWLMVGNVSKTGESHLARLVKERIAGAEVTFLRDKEGQSIGCGVVRIEKRRSLVENATTVLGRLDELDGRPVFVWTDSAKIERLVNSKSHVSIGGSLRKGGRS